MSDPRFPGPNPVTGVVEGSIPRCVLAVYAHPDDPEVSCAGTLTRWADGGAEVHLAIGTMGEKGSRDPATVPAELAIRRVEESAAAAAVMGLASHVFLGLPDGEIENTTELRARLVALIRGLQPDVVMGPDPTAVFFGSSYINHHDHRELGFALLDACAPAASSPLYHPEAGAAHQISWLYLSGTLEPDTWVDIDATLERKVAALRCHGTQIGDAVELAGDIVRRRAEAAGRDIGLRHAEAFRVMRLG